MSQGKMRYRSEENDPPHKDQIIFQVNTNIIVSGVQWGSANNDHCGHRHMAWLEFQLDLVSLWLYITKLSQEQHLSPLIIKSYLVKDPDANQNLLSSLTENK